MIYLTLDGFFYTFVRVLFRIIFTLYNRFSVKWLAPLPKGKVIVASNHNSYLDPLAIGVAFPRRLRYFAKEELFRPFLFGSIVRILGAVPVSREDNASAASALKGFLKLLKDGSDVLIFPEGGRSADGTIQPLEGGVGVIAAHAQATILPVYLKGTYEAMPVGAAFVRPRKITVIFGEPLTYEAGFYKEKGARDKIVADLTESLKALESAAS